MQSTQIKKKLFETNDIDKQKEKRTIIIKGDLTRRSRKNLKKMASNDSGVDTSNDSFCTNDTTSNNNSANTSMNGQEDSNVPKMPEMKKFLVNGLELGQTGQSFHYFVLDKILMTYL